MGYCCKNDFFKGLFGKLLIYNDCFLPMPCGIRIQIVLIIVSFHSFTHIPLTGPISSNVLNQSGFHLNGEATRQIAQQN